MGEKVEGPASTIRSSDPEGHGHLREGAAPSTRPGPANKFPGAPSEATAAACAADRVVQTAMVHVLGIDGAGRHGWVGIVADRSGFVSAEVALTVAELIGQTEQRTGAPLEVVGIDIPIGLPETPTRAVDGLARTFVGPHRRSSVFAAPHPSILEFDDHAAAGLRLGEQGLPGISIQSFRLIPKIREVATITADPRVIEVFPEASFRALAERHLTTSKKTWDGTVQRRRLLAEADPPIIVPDILGRAGQVPVDDVLDAAAAAWSAWRVATGTAECICDPTELDPVTGRSIGMWV